MKVGDITVNEGDVIAIDGSTGEVFLGDVPVVTSPVATYLEEGLDAALADTDAETGELVEAVHRHARPRRRHPAAAGAGQRRHRRRRRPGPPPRRAGHRAVPHRAHVPRRAPGADRAAGAGRRRRANASAALEALLPLQRDDFVQIFTEMDGLPVTVRLLDPPLHEFLPDRTELAVKVAVARERGEDVAGDEKLLAAVERLHESNPMLGLRGVRLGLTVPGLFGMQVRAIAEAAGGPDQGRRRPARGDHGAADRVGDGAAPDPRRGRRASWPRWPSTEGVRLRRARSAR